MISISILYAFLSKVKAWVKGNPWVALTVLLTFILLLIILFGRGKGERITIDVPQEKIDALQKERDQKVEEVFGSIDERRQRDDERIEDAKKKPSRNGNVTAEELERLLK